MNGIQTTPVLSALSWPAVVLKETGSLTPLRALRFCKDDTFLDAKAQRNDRAEDVTVRLKSWCANVLEGWVQRPWINKLFHERAVRPLLENFTEYYFLNPGDLYRQAQVFAKSGNLDDFSTWLPNNLISQTLKQWFPKEATPLLQKRLLGMTQDYRMLSHQQFLDQFDGVPIDTPRIKTKDGVTLQGYWIPAPEPSRKSAFMTHGYFANSGIMSEAIHELRDHGYNVFTFDLRSHGNSTSEKPSSFGWNEAKYDIPAAFRYFKEHYAKQSQTTLLKGYSIATAAIMLTPQAMSKKDFKYFDENVDMISLDSPIVRLKLTEKNNIAELAAALKNLPYIDPAWTKDVLFDYAKRFESDLSKRLLDTPYPVTQYDMVGSFSHSSLIDKPLHIVHASRDKASTPENVQDFIKALKREGAVQPTVTLLTGAHYTKQWRPKGVEGRYVSMFRDSETYKVGLAAFLSKAEQQLGVSLEDPTERIE